MKTTINNIAYEFKESGPETAVDLIRNTCHLTGTKQVCGSGVCGACTIHVDGTPMVSCLLPTYHVEGKQVKTIESYDADNLHPVQRAFMQHDGLQCGYCTPGFIMEGIAFHDHWREEHGTERPSRDEVAEALAGHLCRCGAYAGIYAAMQAACAGEFDGEEYTPQRVDALAKVTGQAKYTTDIQLEGQLVGKLLRSPHPHARILSIDVSEAEKIEGVKVAVATPDRNMILRYVGEPFAAVAAVDAATAQAGLEAIKVEYEILPHVIGMDAALADDAPDIWGRQRRNAVSAAELVTVPGSWDKNLRTMRFNLGGLNPGRARRIINDMRKEGQYVFSETYHNGRQVHTALEPHCAVAEWTTEKTVTVYMSTQGLSFMQHHVAEAFNLRDEDVTIIAQHIGGGFGAKNTLFPEAMAAIALSRRAKAPVGVIPTRPEEMNLGGFRPGARFEITVGMDDTLKPQAIISHAYGDSGVAVSNISANLGTLGYSGGARDLLDYDVVQNHPPGVAFRGPGGPAALWAMEQAIDQMAYEKDVNSLDIRRQWTTDENVLKLYDWVESLDVWKNRPKTGAGEGRYQRGVGVAIGHWAYIYDPDTVIQLSTSPDGICVRTATQDVGNGSRTTLARLVSQAFGIEPSSIQVEIGNTSYPHGPTAGGSRTTVSIADPVQQVTKLMRERLFGLIAEELDLRNASFDAKGIHHPDGLMPWLEVIKHVPPQQAEIKRGPDSQLSQQLGQYAFKMFGLDVMVGQGMGHAAVVVEVEVDTLLGKTRVTRVWENLDVGHIHVPDMARSQVYGGIIQGIGLALYEEKIFDVPHGQNLTTNLQDYRIPAIGDIPEMMVEFQESVREHVKGGGIGMSELSTVPVSSAVANAVFNATGVRCLESPIKPERLIVALNEAKMAEGESA